MLATPIKKASTGLLTVLLVDDQPTWLLMARQQMNAHRQLDVVGVAANATQALKVLRRSKPEVAIVDVQMPTARDGIEAAQLLMIEAPGLVVIMTSANHEQEYAAVAKQIGAWGFVEKSKLNGDAVLKAACCALLDETSEQLRNGRWQVGQ